MKKNISIILLSFTIIFNSIVADNNNKNNILLLDTEINKVEQEPNYNYLNYLYYYLSLNLFIGIIVSLFNINTIKILKFLVNCTNKLERKKL